MTPDTVDVGLHAVDTLLAAMTGLIAVSVWFLRGIKQRQDVTNEHLTLTNQKLDNLAERIVRIEEWRDMHSSVCDERHGQHRVGIAHVEARIDALVARQTSGHA